MTMKLSPPDPARPSSFRRYLARVQRRTQRRTGSGGRYALTVLAILYVPAVLTGAWFAVTGPPPDGALLVGPAAVAVLAAVLVALGIGWSRLGPIPASPAWALWVLSTPIDRGLLLAGRVWLRLSLAWLLGAFLGVAVATAAGLPNGPTLAMIVIGAAGGIVGCGAAIASQRRGVRAGAWRRWAVVLVLLVVAAALQALPTGVLPGTWWWLIAAAVVLGAVAAVIGAVRSVRRIPLDRLTAAATIVAGMTMALTEQSLEWVATAGHSSRRRARASRRPLTRIGQAALAAVCRRLLLRNRTGLTQFATAAVVVYVIAPFSDVFNNGMVIFAVASVLAATAAISGVASTTRRFHRNPHLAAHFGLDRLSSRRTTMIIPTAMTLVWAVLAGPAMVIAGLPIMAVIVPVFAYTVVAYRLTRPAFTPNYAMGLQYRIDLAQRFVRGPAQLVVACAVAGLIATFTT